MKATKAQIAKHLGVQEDDIMATAERDSGQIVAILSDYRKFVFPADRLKGEPQPVPPLAPPPAQVVREAKRARGNLSNLGKA